MTQQNDRMSHNSTFENYNMNYTQMHTEPSC